MSQKGETNGGTDEDEQASHLTHEVWAEGLESGTLKGLSCSSCEYVSATPKAACVRCGSREVSVIDLPPTGSVYTKSTIEIAPAQQGSGYQIALVDFEDARMLGRIADGERVEIGDRVELHDTYEYEGDLVAVFAPV
jgi:uncharacterized OB-fold protein